MGATMEDYKEIFEDLEKRISRRKSKMSRENELCVVSTLLAGFAYNIVAESNLVQDKSDAGSDWGFVLCLSLVGTINMIYFIFTTVLCFKGAKVFSTRLDKK